ncbi:MAG: glycosyltransferase [Ruminococcus sp.]|nr:glycosyltransferase [Ruminococcus sp.]
MKISVIIPVYNKERYLKIILNQIVNQSFSDFECLLIDDGSVDLSSSICDEYCLLDSRFKAVHIENQGVSHARNVGIDMAQGEYLTFIDCDDEIHKDFLKNLYECIENNRVDLVVGGYQKFWDNSDKRIDVNTPFTKQIVNLEDIVPDFAEVQKKCGLYGCCVAKIFKRDFLGDIRFDEGLKLAEDLDFYLRVIAKAKTLYFDDKNYYFYRQEAENSTVLVNDEDIDYYSQLCINIRYKKFLLDVNGYFGTNKNIVDELISNYIYFSVFYCKNNLLKERFFEIINLIDTNSLLLIPNGFMQKLIFSTIKCKSYFCVKLILYVYRSLREIKNI